MKYFDKLLDTSHIPYIGNESNYEKEVLKIHLQYFKESSEFYEKQLEELNK